MKRIKAILTTWSPVNLRPLALRKCGVAFFDGGQRAGHEDDSLTKNVEDNVVDELLKQWTTVLDDEIITRDS